MLLFLTQFSICQQASEESKAMMKRAAITTITTFMGGQTKRVIGKRWIIFV